MGNDSAEFAADRESATEEPPEPSCILHLGLPEYSPDHIDNLPAYTGHHDPDTPLTIQGLYQILAIDTRARENDVNNWRRYIASDGLGKQTEQDREYIISRYFSAIIESQKDVIALLIDSHLVTANTRMVNKTRKTSTTPLLMAVSKRNVQIVQQLLELGADPNEFSCLPSESSCYEDLHTPPLRNALQLAASMGHLVLVKLLMEHYHCDDSIVAPDGQIALRLAAENGHREIVDYLPARRGGGFRRWNHKNKNAIRRATKAAKGIGTFFKIFLWDIEKFFLWTVPKNVIVKPFLKGCTWCWENRKGLGPWCTRQLVEMPGRVKRFVKWTGRTTVRIGKFLREVILKIPQFIKKLGVWIWNFVMVRFPKSVAIVARWVADGFTSLAKLVWNAILKVVSLLSTMVEAIVSFFKRLTLRDIWNGFCDTLEAVFVAFPKLVGSWIVAFGEGTYKVMKLLFGTLGEVIWYIGYGLLKALAYVPRKLWVIIQSIGSVIVKAGYEVRVWMDPKAT